MSPQDLYVIRVWDGRYSTYSDAAQNAALTGESSVFHMPPASTGGAPVPPASLSSLGVGSITFGNPWNTPPSSQEAVIATLQDTPVVIASDLLLHLSVDPDGDSLAIASINNTGQGKAVLGEDSITFTPASGFHGLDKFLYAVSDGLGGIATAPVNVVVLPPSVRIDSPSIGLEDGCATIAYPSVETGIWTIQRTEKLDQSWSDTLPICVGNSRFAAFREAVTNSACFYRLKHVSE
jgi:hypothetical protein